MSGIPRREAWNGAEIDRIRERSALFMQAILSNPKYYDFITNFIKTPGMGDFPTVASKLAVEYAKALEKETQKLL